MVLHENNYTRQLAPADLPITRIIVVFDIVLLWSLSVNIIVILEPF